MLITRGYGIDLSRGVTALPDGFFCSKKRVLQMERVLKAVPADLRVKMEALVHDLTLALEESSNSANLRRRWGIRRRARSTGNIRKCKGRQFRCDLKNPFKRNVGLKQEQQGNTLSILRLITVYLCEARSPSYYQDNLCRNESLQHEEVRY